MSNDNHTLNSDVIAATVKADGAELCSLRNAAGVELLWQAGPQWPRHAPLLFPIVGRLKNDELRHRGKTYPMTQHGFARDLRFEWLKREPACCKTNTGDESLPASVGAHPAFNWPLVHGANKEAYTLTFSDAETAPIRRLKDGLVRATAEPSPVSGKRLVLSEKLFDDAAVILDRLASKSVRYAADRGPSIEISWDGCSELGIWSKPGGAPFLCIEPWHGFASPADFDGEFTDKPGLMHIAPGGRRSLSYRIRVS